ncbi:filamentous hemagglutinin family outer membrane protein (plasmid) [Thalassoporum mexicanum PCC 7367]|uniref:two-partner secretion domain-containing protein n=1 Tax=Thalassoporum mexicanum TaxID=3457544 RepID=UPI00029FED18|nr:filamentous hemagglutinin N-terminal domain-containing protein [Pseudanabaena sp. PCC 7367]AFY72064.1 filamentous hemagglutinin family outer membrane protein [Pseudanabaena sp. PCC 7367]
MADRQTNKIERQRLSSLSSAQFSKSQFKSRLRSLNCLSLALTTTGIGLGIYVGFSYLNYGAALIGFESKYLDLDLDTVALAQEIQIVPDRSLPQNSIVQPDGNTLNITGGAINGANLFHSFSEFSLNSGQTAHFQNDAAIANILTRVTGNNVSEIDGLIRANGNANLFLLNPNGILFGENARLDLGGSFVATSADAIEFADGNLFAAQDAELVPLLTMTAPVGLQFNGNDGVNGAIEVQGNGHNFTRESPIFAPVLGVGMLEDGLQVQPGQNLALIGNGINVNGGLLAAEGAHIELGSLSAGRVLFTPIAQGWEFNYESSANRRDLKFSDINLRDRAAVDGSGSLTSGIYIQAHNLNITDGSVVAIQNQGLMPGSDIRVNANGTVALSGTTTDTTIQSSITNTTLTPGASGAIAINAADLHVLEGARLVSRTFSSGRSGDIELNVNNDFRIIGFSPINPLVFSTVSSTTLSDGRAGDIRVNTQNLISRDAGVLSSATFDRGQGGDLTVVATDLISLAGAEPFTTTPSSIAATTFNSGNAGNVTVTAKNLVIEQGGRIDSSTTATGNAGSVEINVSEAVILSGDPTQPGEPGLIASASAIVSEGLQNAFNLPPVPTGNSGNVTVNTKLLQATNGGLVSVVSNGSGHPGTVRINSDHILLTNRGGILALTDQESGGNIEITTGDIDMFAAFINASSIGTGDGGNIRINATGNVTVADVDFLNVFNNVFVPFIFITPGSQNIAEVNGILTLTNSAGRSGDIDIQANQLTVRDGGLVVTGVFASSTAGNLTINANQLLNVDGGLVVAISAIGDGQGGDASITSPVIKLSQAGLITSITLGSGNAGNVIVQASEAIEITDTLLSGSPIPGFEVIPSSISSAATATSTGNGGSLVVITPQLTLSNQGVIAVNADNIGQAGNLLIQSDIISLDNSDITGNSISGQGGNVNLQVGDRLILRNASNISTTAGLDLTSSGNGGNINISTPVLVALEQSNISANAFLGMGGNIDIVTAGLFTSTNSEISSSSRLGVDGVVEVNSPDIDPSSGLVELETKVVDFSNLVAVGCDADRGNTFVVTGRGGLPATPREIVRAEPSVIDWRSPFSTASSTTNNQSHLPDPSQSVSSVSSVSKATNPTPSTNPPSEITKINEVQGWRLDPNGQVILVADATNYESQSNRILPKRDCTTKQ